MKHLTKHCRRGLAVACATLMLALPATAGQTDPAAGGAHAAAGPTHLADLHADADVKCKGCHGNQPKTEPVSVDTCTSCHGGYEKIKTAARSARLHPNPHTGHYLDLECMTCHKGHEKSENFCDSCHGGEHAK